MGNYIAIYIIKEFHDMLPTVDKDIQNRRHCSYYQDTFV